MARVPALGDLRTRNRSVDDVSAYGDDTMNVWQTLEVISGNNLRKKYHYDGYSDVENVLRTITASCHRRDSFADKAKSPDRSKKYVETAPAGGGQKNEQVNVSTTQPTKDIVDKRKQSSATVPKRRTKNGYLPVEPVKKNELNLLEYTDLVQCSFNIPRISARLERLMGTNVVRLTDRKYMKELRERIDEDYRVDLSNRIKNREIKELERERNLILTGKTEEIPDELSGDPIFVVNKRANIEIVKRRAKLKTNREKNADRLLRQGLKWERERHRHEAEEEKKQHALAVVRMEQAALEKQYKAEDAERGLDLLRVDVTVWQDCEKDLCDFLDAQRNKMKERSWRIPTPFSSDPLDTVNVLRAREKLREEKKRLRLERKMKAHKKAHPHHHHKHIIHHIAAKMQRVVKAVHAFNEALNKIYEDDDESKVSVYLDDDEASAIPSSDEDLVQPADLIVDMKKHKTQEMEKLMQEEVLKGYLASKEEYSNLRYSDQQIMKLRHAANIHELYIIAEKIIIGEVEEELIVDEELGIEEDDDEG